METQPTRASPSGEGWWNSLFGTSCLENPTITTNTWVWSLASLLQRNVSWAKSICTPRSAMGFQIVATCSPWQMELVETNAQRIGWSPMYSAAFMYQPET